MQQNIELAKPRDFGEIIGDTFVFIRQNLKPLLKYFFIFCGFFVLATTVTTVMVEFKAFHLVDNYDPADFGSRTIFDRIFPLLGGYLLLLFFAVMQYVTFNVMVLCFMTLYKQKRNNIPTVEEMWGYMKFYFLKILGSSILLFILLVIGTMLCVIPGIYLWPVFALIPPIMIVENTSFGYAFNQSFRLISNNWWITFGALLVIYIILYVINAVVTLPASAVGAGNAFLHLTSGTRSSVSLSVLILTAILQAITYFFHILMTVGAALCYFNLSESKEGTSLIERMNEFGAPQQETGPQPEEY